MCLIVGLDTSRLCVMCDHGPIDSRGIICSTGVGTRIGSGADDSTTSSEGQFELPDLGPDWERLTIQADDWDVPMLRHVPPLFQAPFWGVVVEVMSAVTQAKTEGNSTRQRRWETAEASGDYVDCHD